MNRIIQYRWIYSPMPQIRVRLAPITAVVNFDHDQQPPRLIRAIRRLRQFSQRRPVKIFPHAGRGNHRAALQTQSAVDLDFHRLGNPRESETARIGIRLALQILFATVHSLVRQASYLAP